LTTGNEPIPCLQRLAFTQTIQEAGVALDLIIRNGTVVTASDQFAADVGVRNGKIAVLASYIDEPATRELDATGCLVLPGGVDVHTHMDSLSFGMESADDWRTGTIAAACGGTTTIVDFAHQVPGQGAIETIEGWHRRAQGKAAIDYGFHCIVADPTDAVIAELTSLPDLGVTSYKVFLAYKGMSMVDDAQFIRILAEARDAGAMVMVHAEHGELVDHLQRKLVAAGKLAPTYHAASRPPRVEAEATARAIALAEVIGASLYIVHVSCEEALEEVMRGKARGVDVHAETCTHYLYASEADLERPNFEGAKFVFTPPPRDPRNHNVLWSALARDDLEVVSSDHSAWSFDGQKSRGRDDFTQIPNGAPGIEERLMMTWQGVNAGRITPSRFVELTATAPARIFGLSPRKGTIAIGSDADLVVWDPAARATISQAMLHHAVDYTVYEGTEIRGMPRDVLLRGEMIVERREYVGTPGTGRFLRRDRVSVA
jgi:dihydropyrimidinase